MGASATGRRDGLQSIKIIRFGENLHDLTEENLGHLWDAIDNYTHKLGLRLICELVGRNHPLIESLAEHLKDTTAP